MSIKNKTIRVRDKLSGLAKINMKLEELEKKTQSMQLMLTDMQNNVNALCRRPIPPISIHIDQKTLLTKIFSGIKIYLDPRDLSVASHIAVDGIWEQQQTKAWLAVLKRNDTVLDIGANFGYFGLLAGQFVDRKKSKVVLFEANKALVPYINKSVSINWFNEQMRVENLAVSDKNGEVKLTVMKDFLGSSSLQSIEEVNSYMSDNIQFEVAENISVESVTVDSYCKKNNIDEVNLIKMDIEGYEEKAYAGMRGIVKKSKNITFFIEFTKDSYDNPKKFFNDMLEDFGYVYIISDNGDIKKPKASSYEDVIGEDDNWVMPIFSKNSILDKESNTVIF